MPHTYQEEFRVFQFECDPWDRMTPGAVLRRVQEIGTLHCESLGLNEELYTRTGTVLLLAKLSLQICNRMPAIEETVTLKTRAYGMRRAVYHRVTGLYAQDGERLCEVDSRWVLVDRAARRILRRPLPEFEVHFNDAPPPQDMHPMDLPRPDSLYTVEELRAGYCLCDRNGHVNNARYADLMCDHLPLQRLKEAMPRQLVLHYHTEIPLGQSFTLQSNQVGDDGYYFAAGADSARDFEGFVRF